MKITDYKGYEVHIPTSGGKAGRGRQRTSTIQLRAGNCIVKQVRFVVGDLSSRSEAILKARLWADQQ